MTHHTSSKGFVILFTILIAAIIMVIGLGIYSIATREKVLSGTAREAQYAFFAADAGVECALFIEHLDQTAAQKVFAPGSTTPFTCGDEIRTLEGGGQGTITSSYVFMILVDRVKKTCAQVSVFDTMLGTTPARRIIAQGYNVCNMSTRLPLKGSSLLVERVLDTTYARRDGQGTPVSPSTPTSPSSPLSPATPSTPLIITPSPLINGGGSSRSGN